MCGPTRERRLPAAPVREILKRAGVRVTPDCVEAARFLAEDTVEWAAKRAARDVEYEGRQTMDGDHFATWWGI